jgi:hypothetical protein
MSTQQDELVYWNAMASLRAEEAKLSVLPYKAGLILDARDEGYNEAGWEAVEINVTPSAANLRGYVFPKHYFLFCQRYIAAALENKPLTGAGSTAKAKVLWLLDVQAHVCFGWLALGIPYTWVAARVEAERMDHFEDPNWGRGHVTGGTLTPWGAYASNQPRDRPAPFALSPLHLAARLQPYTPSGADATTKGTGLLPKLIDEVQPWLVGGFKLGSKDARDAGVLTTARAKKDGPLARGILQARLWSVIDFSWPRNFRTGAPLPSWHYGTASATASILLPAYIAQVAAHESPQGELVEQAGSGTNYQSYGRFPNLAYAFESPGPDVLGFLRVDYDRWLDDYTLAWIASATPTDNLPVLDSTNQLVRGDRQPVSITDYRAFERGEYKAVKDRMEASITGDYSKIKPANDAERKAIAIEQKAHKWANGVPVLAQINKVLGKLATLLVGWLGVARGVSSLPKLFRIIPVPFYRTLSAPDYRMVPDGTTTSALLRVINAMQNTVAAATTPTAEELAEARALRALPALTPAQRATLALMPIPLRAAVMAERAQLREQYYAAEDMLAVLRRAPPHGAVPEVAAFQARMRTNTFGVVTSLGGYWDESTRKAAAKVLRTTVAALPAAEVVPAFKSVNIAAPVRPTVRV